MVRRIRLSGGLYIGCVPLGAEDHSESGQRSSLFKVDRKGLNSLIRRVFLAG